MTRYTMVVLSNPVAGREQEFESWYENQHLPDLLRVPGMVGARRYRIALGEGWRHMAIYDVETDDLDGVMEEMRRRAEGGEIVMSSAFDANFLLVAGQPVGSPATSDSSPAVS